MLDVSSFRPASTTPLAGALDLRTVFGPDRRPLFRIRSGIGFTTIIGAIDLTASVGAWRASGTVTDLADGLEPHLSDVSLWLLPLTFQVQWSVDVLYRLFSFPLVPFVRTGFGVTRWTFGRVTASQTLGSGWAAGPELAGGIEAILDDVDPRLAKEAEREFHIRSSRVMCQWSQFSWSSSGRTDFSGGGFGCGLVIIL